MEQKVKAILIIEIAGRPADYVKNTLKVHVEQIKNIKGVDLINYTVSEPKQIEAEREMYTCFAEVEVQTENFAKITELMFDFLPSSVEIIEPKTLNFNLTEATAFLNDLSGRLHKYDEVAKIAQYHNQHLAVQLKQMQEKLKSLDSKEESKKPKSKESKKK